MDVISPITEFFNWAAPVLDNVPIIRVIIGIVLVFFAPGFAWTLVLFKQITHLERLVLSFALSLTLVTLSILGLNIVINMRITGLNALLTILALIIIPLIIYFARKYIYKRKTQQTEEK
jgi:uncharacterized membrane protein